MIVICPKCKIKLKVDDAKIAPQGTRFKCPKCSITLLVKKPVPAAKKDLDKKTILVAHADPATAESIQSILTSEGYRVVLSHDGIDAMAKALRDCPYLAIIDIALPKIFGFELCKRFKTRTELEDMKCILLTAVYDKTKYRREPSSLHDADAYIEEHAITEDLVGTINRLSAPSKEAGSKPADSVSDSVDTRQTPAKDKPASSPVAPAPEKPVFPDQQPVDEAPEKALRLARTIINDIYLYNTERVNNALKTDSFHTEFASELREGLRLYESRIPDEVRSQGDFFNEAIDTFLTTKKKQIG